MRRKPPSYNLLSLRRDMRFLFWKKEKVVKLKDCELCDTQRKVIEDLLKRLEHEKRETNRWWDRCLKSKDKVRELQESISGTQPLVLRLYDEAFKDTTTIANLRVLVDARETEVFRLNDHIKELQKKLELKKKKK
jgi:hypothetical protein